MQGAKKMKLKDFDFRIWDKTKEAFLKQEPTLIKLDNERVIAGRISRFYANTADIADMFIGNGNDLEIELWTGFYDSKGTKIYEGDILAHDNGYGIEYHTKVVFENRVFKIAIIEHPAVEIIEGLDTGFVEVVGNIHENTELLNH